MAMNKVVALIRSLVGVKGLDGTSIATQANPVPVEVQNQPEGSSTIKGVLDDAATTDAAEDASADARITPKRALHTNLRNQAGTEVGTSTAPLEIKHRDSGIQVPMDMQSMWRTRSAFSTAPLAANSTYTSTTLDANSLPIMSGRVLTDQAGTLSIQTSGDGLTNWVAIGEAMTVLANVGKTFVAGMTSRYGRIQFVNGATPQGSLDIEVTLGVM